MIKKFVRKDAPYIENTFNAKDDKLVGRSGYLGGGAITYLTATTVQVAPFAFVQAGLIVADDVGVASLGVPDFSVDTRPVYVVVSSPDTSEGSGVLVLVTTDVGQVTADAVVLAVRTNGVWSSPPSLSIEGHSGESREADKLIGAGVQVGLDLKKTFSGTQNVSDVRVKIGVGMNARGELVHAGTRDGGTAGENATLAHGVLDGKWPRNNYWALRSPDLFPGPNTAVQRLIGGTIALENDVEATGQLIEATSFSHPVGLSRASDNHTAWVWLKTTDIRHVRTDGTSGEAIVSGPTSVYTPVNPFDGTKDISAVVRSDGAIVIAFVENIAATNKRLMLVSIDFSTGAVVDAVVPLSSALPNSVRAPRMVVDEQNILHIVAQHNESLVPATPNNQIYYFRVDATAGASFGTLLSTTPHFVTGGNDGGNDVDPSIARDRRGNLYVTYAKCTGNNETGDIVLTSLDSMAAVLSTEFISTDAISASAGGESPYTIPVVITNASLPRAVVTPLDELFVAFAVTSSTFLYARDFKARIGAKSINVFTSTAGSSAAIRLELLTDDLATLRIFLSETGGESIVYTRLDTVIAPERIFKPSRLILRTLTSVTGQLMGAVVSASGSARFGGTTALGNFNASSVAASNNGRFSTHPKDVLLGAWTLGKLADGATLLTVRQNRSRPVRSNNPVQVGKDGDFIGFDSLNEAIFTTRASGLEIRLNPGLHELFTRTNGLDGTGVMLGGLHIEGAPGSVVAVATIAGSPLKLGGVGGTVVASNPAPGVFTLGTLTDRIFVGDVLEIENIGAESDFVHIIEVVAPNKIRVFPSISHAPGGASVYAGSIRLRGIKFIGDTSPTAAPLTIMNAWDPQIDRCDFENMALVMDSWQRGTIDRCKLLKTKVTFQTVSFPTRRTVVRDCDSLGLIAGDGYGFLFDGCEKMVVHGNRSTDHDPTVFGYKIANQSDFTEWSHNLGTVDFADPGRLTSDNVTVKASNSVIAKDIVADRINGGIYDMRIADLASILATLTGNDNLSFGSTITFEDESALV